MDSRNLKIPEECRPNINCGQWTGPCSTLHIGVTSTKIRKIKSTVSNTIAIDQSMAPLEKMTVGLHRSPRFSDSLFEDVLLDNRSLYPKVPTNAPKAQKAQLGASVMSKYRCQTLLCAYAPVKLPKAVQAQKWRIES